MKKRKKYLVDKNYQYKTTFSIVGISMLLLTLLIGLMIAVILYNNSKVNEIYNFQNKVLYTLTTQEKEFSTPHYKTVINTISERLKKNEKLKNQLLSFNFKLLIIIIIVCIINSIFLFVYIIRKTHQIAGPIYVITQQINDLLNGKKPELRPLRDKDELKNFYSLFKKLATKINKKDL